MLSGNVSTDRADRPVRLLVVVQVLLMPACRSAVLLFAEHNLLSRLLDVVQAPLVLVPACEYIERTSQKTFPQITE